ncbi:MAG: RagB/SusD family nutrient uptake outer membrane protein [Bacteroides sp.]|nr:RagB/SusD family nutrient uptake outer membrane protein [Bacteroides sp.]MBD5375108.1 RagB/SusD family nutrient uptake outer membrane protein [Bacteroides sp.]
MKNKYISIFASVALAVGASSCVDLDTAPLAQKSEATMWQTVQDAEQGVSILYNYMPDAMWSAAEDVYTDNSTYGIKWAVDARCSGLWEPTAFSWSGEYTYIRYANLVFAHIDEVEDMDEATRNNVLGQAYFFRAYIYFMLIKQFGDVPYFTEPLNLDDQEDITRTDWKIVYDNVMSDFDNAIKLLPADAATGRVNSVIAQAYKARAALYFANPECQHYVADGYQVAANNAKAVIDSGKYDLYGGDYTGTAADFDPADYASMFWDFNVDNSKEGLMEYHRIPGVSGSVYYIGFSAFPKLGWGGTNPTQDFVDCFEDVEGAPIATSKLYNPLKPNENRDPRLEANVLFSGQTYYGVEVHTEPLTSSGNTGLYPYGCSDQTLTGYYTLKWLNPDVYPETAGWSHRSASCDMRFTEVLLTYAEAMNELSPLSEEAFAAVNRVRARVGMPALQNTDATKPTYCATQDDLRQRIRNEWRIEFFAEGDHRQWDIRRWNIAEKVLNTPRYSMKFKVTNVACPEFGETVPAYKEGETPSWYQDLTLDKETKVVMRRVVELYVGEGQEITQQFFSYGPHNYVFPVPQHDIDLNKNITQNPGYN